jgi:hypothetical protein
MATNTPRDGIRAPAARRLCGSANHSRRTAKRRIAIAMNSGMGSPKQVGEKCWFNAGSVVE